VKTAAKPRIASKRNRKNKIQNITGKMVREYEKTGIDPEKKRSDNQNKNA
jgi:hypothetical protein